MKGLVRHVGQREWLFNIYSWSKNSI